MKRKMILPVVALVVSLVAGTAFAATTSPEKDPRLVKATGEDGSDLTPGFRITNLTDTSEVDEINTMISDANKDLKAADNKPAKLNGKNGTLEADLDAALKAKGVNAKASDLAVAEAFDLSYVNDQGEVEHLGGTFEFELSTGETLVAVIHNYETGKWEVIDPSLVTIDGNHVTVKLSTTSAIAFLTVKAAEATPTPTPAADDKKSAQTGEFVGTYVLIIAAALATAGIVCVKRAKKSTASK